MKRLLFSLLPAIPFAATAGDYGLYLERPLDFSLYLEQRDINLDDGDSIVDSSVDRIGIVWRERYGERLQLGLLGGYASLVQGNNPVTAGRELDGYYAGVSLDLDLVTFPAATLFLNASVVYQRVDDDGAMQRIVISWTEPSVRFGVRGPLGAGLSAYGGVRYADIDGRQRLSGTLNETRDISETDSTGGFAGLELGLEGDGYVGAIVENGIDRRVGLYFGRRF